MSALRDGAQTGGSCARAARSGGAHAGGGGGAGPGGAKRSAQAGAGSAHTAAHTSMRLGTAEVNDGTEVVSAAKIDTEPGSPAAEARIPATPGRPIWWRTPQTANTARRTRQVLLYSRALRILYRNHSKRCADVIREKKKLFNRC